MNDKFKLQQVIEYNKIKNYCFKRQLPYYKIEEYEKILNARYHKNSRIKKRLLWLVLNYKNIWFCTFSINNHFINKSERTKRDKIKSVLNQYDLKYILNVDYGLKGTERQHFHCICATNDDLDLDFYFKSNLGKLIERNGKIEPYFGWTYSKKFLCEKDDFVKVSKYLNKLANHCIKASTRNYRIVYNFKGYDLLFKNQHELTLHYKLDYYNLFENVPLLDKGDVNGNFF